MAWRLRAGNAWQAISLEMDVGGSDAARVAQNDSKRDFGLVFSCRGRLRKCAAVPDRRLVVNHTENHVARLA